MRFRDIPQFISDGSYQVNMSWEYLIEWLDQRVKEEGLQLNQIFSEVMSGLKNSKLNSWSLFFRVVRLDVLFISTIRTGIVLDQRLDMLISCVLMASSELQLFSGL